MGKPSKKPPVSLTGWLGAAPAPVWAGNDAANDSKSKKKRAEDFIRSPRIAQGCNCDSLAKVTAIRIRLVVRQSRKCKKAVNSETPVSFFLMERDAALTKPRQCNNRTMRVWITLSVMNNGRLQLSCIRSTNERGGI